LALRKLRVEPGKFASNSRRKIMRMDRRRYAVLFVAAIVLAFGGSLARFANASPQAAGGSGYQLVKKVTLGGMGGWDYLNADPVSHRVFISRGNHVMVVDADGNVVGDIPNLMGTHGAALADEFNHGFTSNGGSNSATMFDLKSLAVLSDIKLPDAVGPDGYVYDPASKRVFTFNGRSTNATAVDAKTGEAVTGSVPLGGKPEAAQADGAGHIFVNIEDKDQLLEFDSGTLKVMNTWPLAPCMQPSGMASDVVHKRLFIGCHNQLMVIVDFTAGKVIATEPIGTGIDADAFDPATGFAFASCGDGTITVVHEDTPDKYTVVDTIKTQQGARTMALDTSNHNIYTVSADMTPAPAATPENPRPRPVIVPNTFTLLIYGKGGHTSASVSASNSSQNASANGGDAAKGSAGGRAATEGNANSGAAGSLVAQGKALYESTYMCVGCHGMNGEGTDLAPDLVGTRLSTDEIAKFLEKPSADASDKGMPSIDATSPDLKPLVAYVLSVKRAQ
jgi:mono/diheme cytochrome c family protein